MTSIAFYPGSFDPVTNGHLDIIQRAGKLAQTLVIGVGVHHGKKPMFDADQRVAMLTHECLALAKSGSCQFQIVTFENLAVDAAREHGAFVDYPRPARFW